MFEFVIPLARKSVSLGVLVAAALAMSPKVEAAVIVAELEDFTNPGGGFFATVTIEDIGPPDTVSITLDISDPINAGLTQGDILAVWFDVTDESILADLQTAFNLALSNVFVNIVPAGTIQNAVFSANAVNSLGGGLNLTGGGGAGANFDIGIAVGIEGAPGGFNQTISFDFIGVTTATFADERIGMRVQSIEGVVFAEGSSKLLGSGTPGTDVPEPATLALLGIGLLGAGYMARRRRDDA